ncbi:hypothetical protein QLX67_05035 [Balneolaceae bacterium ANBcel3]|nr:hypothetical protein [Balneolaceae bacterium ANBcel3]
MNETDSVHPVWKKLIKKEFSISLSFLAGKLLLGKLQVQYGTEPKNLVHLARKMHDLYYLNKDLPSVKKDIELINRER